MRFLFILIFLSSCGDSDRRRTLAEQEEVPLNVETFDTRLTNNLQIKGERCRGTEVVNSEEGSLVCQSNQYLVTVDDINTCTPEGCTELFVAPVIATLEESGGDELTTFYEIDAALPDETVSRILDSVFLQARVNEDPLVIFR